LQPGYVVLARGTTKVLQVTKLRPDAIVPTRAHPGDAGLDLCAVEACDLAPGGRDAVPTGLAVAIPPGWAGLVVPRSGLARRHGVTVANAPGLIDAGYRGELQVLLVNLSDRPHRVEVGDRVAQLVCVPVDGGDAVLVDELPPSDGRGDGGFGSTGR
jgi:dUTP pyrophosphatase